MDQPYEVKDDGTIVISGAELAKHFIVSAERLTLSKGVEQSRQEKADLIERRLQRIEEALALEAICAH